MGKLSKTIKGLCHRPQPAPDAVWNVTLSDRTNRIHNNSDNNSQPDEPAPPYSIENEGPVEAPIEPPLQLPIVAGIEEASVLMTAIIKDAAACPAQSNKKESVDCMSQGLKKYINGISSIRSRAQAEDAVEMMDKVMATAYNTVAPLLAKRDLTNALCVWRLACYGAIAKAEKKIRAQDGSSISTPICEAALCLGWSILAAKLEFCQEFSIKIRSTLAKLGHAIATAPSSVKECIIVEYVSHIQRRAKVA